MQERRKAGTDENTNTMAVEAVKSLQQNSDIRLSDVDLIVGGTYTPHDTIVTLAHQVQHYLDIAHIPVISLSSACSTLLNAIEIVEGYFATDKASKALVVVSEHNTAFHNEMDPKAGHLWGDGSSALLIEKVPSTRRYLAIRDLHTGGAATVGQATVGVSLKPLNGGISMPAGKDVFINACHYMASATKNILEKNDYSISDLSLLIPHQANLRITRNVAQNLGMDESKAVTNVTYLGNTGCAGCGIGLSEKWNEIKAGDVIVMTVFGGGYSYGAMLLEAREE
jgi:3-oxoacyl-[acyl-carrier-protein] synthase-3